MTELSGIHVVPDPIRTCEMPSGPSIMFDISCSCCAFALAGYAPATATTAASKSILLKFITDSLNSRGTREHYLCHECGMSPGGKCLVRRIAEFFRGISRAVAAAQADERVGLSKSKARALMRRDLAEELHAGSQA
jgi:hypothetical protein